MMRLWLFLSAFTFFVGCGDPAPHDGKSTLDYLTLGDAKNKKHLIHKLNRPIKIHVKGAYFGQINASAIKLAVMKWLEPLRAYDSTITADIAVGDYKNENDLTIEMVDADGRAHYNNWLFDNKIVLYSNGYDTFGVLLHEMGHAFGLADTYVEGVWTCKSGQPESLMCRIPYSNAKLEQDDIEGIRFLYCKHHSDKCAGKV